MDLMLRFQWCMTCSLLITYVLITLLVLTVGLYYYGNSTFTHFSRQDVPHYKSMPFMGNMRLCVMKNKPYPHYVREVYNNIKEKPYGCLHSFQQPVIVLKDPALIKSIMTKDFHSFSDHRPVFIENRGPLWKSGLPHLKGKVNQRERCVYVCMSECTIANAYLFCILLRIEVRVRPFISALLWWATLPSYVYLTENISGMSVCV